MKKEKPEKPRPDFPLGAHANGQWCKKMKGKIHYFGGWDDPEGALRRYLKERDYILSGLPVPGGSVATRVASTDSVSVLEVLDRWLKAKRRDVESGDITERTWKDYRGNAKIVLGFLDGSKPYVEMTPDDFGGLRSDLMRGVSVTTGANRIRMARIGFLFGKELGLPEPNWGGRFSEPKAKVKRRARREAGPRLHTPQEIRKALSGTSSPQIKAMILLGINCAFGNSDVGRLRWKYIGNDHFHNYHREKTEEERRCPLWDETWEALEVVRGIREERGGATPESLVFRTKYGNPFTPDAVAKEMGKLNLQFYNLRRTFRTVANETGRREGIRLIMGHVPKAGDMDAVYIQKIPDWELLEIVGHVRGWLFGYKNSP